LTKSAIGALREEGGDENRRRTERGVSLSLLCISYHRSPEKSRKRKNVLAFEVDFPWWSRCRIDSFVPPGKPVAVRFSTRSG
jgi:hypothetical protein